MPAAKQRTSILVAKPPPWANIPGFYPLKCGQTELGEETLSRQQHLCVLSPPASPLRSGSSDERPSFLRCHKPNQTAEEWNFPLVKVLGKNPMSLSLETQSSRLLNSPRMPWMARGLHFLHQNLSRSHVSRVLTLGT